jgi:arylsulfatase A-like enzyme
MDWTATFLNAAGVAPHPDYPLDGIDLLTNEKPRNLYWRMKFREQKAVRSGTWKYLSIEGNEFLYDLSNDARERANIKYREPARFEELKADYIKWEASVPPIPPDAKVSLVYGPAEMAKPS